MAEIRQRSLQRPNYFTGQLLGEEDLKAEQKYHLERIRRHASLLHAWGVDGLEVVKDGDRGVLVQRGTALDRAGREIVLPEPQRLSLAEFGHGTVVHVTIAYEEGFEDSDRAGEAENYTRRTELAVLRALGTAPPLDGSVLALARVETDGEGRIARIDLSVRRPMGSRIAAGGVGSLELSDASVSREKLHPSLRSGWVRLPFKPSSFAETEAGARNFIIGVTRTYCDSHGAKGTMGIPVPSGATRLKTFVIAGATNMKGIDIELHRCGWHGDGREEGTALKQEIPGGRSHFRSVFTLNWELDADSHAVAVYVCAKGEAEISLVAAEFE